MLDFRRVPPLSFALPFVLAAPAVCQWHPAGRDAKLGPMLDDGLARYETPELTLRLVKSSGTVAGLEPRQQPLGGPETFDFTPAELLAARSTDGYYHLGDLDLRLREAGSTEWRGYSTALERHPVTALATQAGELAREDLKATLTSEDSSSANNGSTSKTTHSIARPP